MQSEAVGEVGMTTSDDDLGGVDGAVNSQDTPSGIREAALS